MSSPEPPCRRDCDARRAGCHGESCPYGWAEYEKAKLTEDRARTVATSRHDDELVMTAAKVAAVYGPKRRRGRRKQT